jgi:Ca2+-binding RTX toxin-like protein
VAGNITVLGGDGDDTIVGGAGNELLLGEAGNDSLSGNEGDDTLDGGAGLDTLDGGAGNDTLLNGELVPLTPRIRIADRILFADDTWGGGDISIVRAGVDDVIVRVNDFSRQFDMDDFDGVLLRGNNGYDRITIDASRGPIPGVTLDGGNGNDTLWSEDGVGDDMVFGGDGSDTARIDAGDITSGIETFA